VNTILTSTEQLLARLIAYLEGTNLAITPAVGHRALSLMQLALQQQEMDPLAFLMEQLPLQFTLPELALPPLTPPINRGSIGYYK
jgi:hypothetical protein